MITITTSTNGRADVSFPYDRHAVEIMHSLAGRKWESRRRCWSIDVRLVPAAAQLFAKRGFRVTVDGLQDTGLNPFPALRASMDAETWRRVSKVLEEVLGQQGGDERLYRLLVRTNQADREQRRKVAS